jgi:hypothetical protein
MRAINAIFSVLGVGTLTLVSPVLDMSVRADDIILDRMEAFYVENNTGKLSANIMPPSQYIDFWNTIIGEGGAVGGGGYDILLVAHFKSLKQEGNSPAIQVKVTNMDKKKIILDRKNFFVSFDSYAKQGAAADGSKAFFIEDTTCDHLKIDVTIAEKSWTYDLPFVCGE